MESLESRIRFVWTIEAAILALLVTGVVGLFDWLILEVPEGVLEGAGLVVVAIGIVFAILRYRIWGFEVRDDSLFLVRGVLTRVHTSVPFVRIQHVDTQRGPFERAIGLASVVVYTAGSRGADITIPGLTPERAADLREQLRELAAESEFEDAV